ncbi:DENN domain-containing protein 3-like isoform X2 [Dreissena polymorpha]|uniref:DENN domain-containing protein 3-like isoform X2 n=1 Tax=Dreissena polymorpha TaxID=45954 RepID=UPI00226552AD|nr:DENN domain-containing protein 3-like isoform X2 [Dreissena polymorpha]
MASVLIPNCLADVVLLVGVNHLTGLNPASTEMGSSVKVSLEQEFEAHVLTVISATDMVSFFPFIQRVKKYPPQPANKSWTVSSDERESSAETINKRPMMVKSLRIHRSPVDNQKVFTRHLSMYHIADGATPVPLPKLPICDEVIKSIPTFCFPDGLKIFQQKPDNVTHCFVLTDMSGRRSFAACLTFYRPFFVLEDTEGNIYVEASSKQAMNTSSNGKGGGKDKGKQNVDSMKDKGKQNGDSIYYLPHCFVIISKYPYYTTLKECLSSLLTYTERDPEEMTTFLMEYSNILTHTVVPPAGNLAVRINLYQLPVTLVPSLHADRPVIDLPLHLAFQCFGIDEFLKVLSCILLEERIVFLSSNYSLLTVVMETMLTLILPLKWRFTYSTILPSIALGYLESPGTFMYGVHSKHKHQVRQVEGLVLVDIDQGTIEINADSDTESDPEIIPLPREITEGFRRKWSQLKAQFELQDTKRPFCYNMEELRESTQHRIWKQNRVIAHAGLEFMVTLFRDVVQSLNLKHHLFDSEEFLKQKNDDPFYKRLFKTDMFKVFLEERMTEKTDYFSEFLLKTKGFSSRPVAGMGRRHSSAQSISSIQEVPVEKRVIGTFDMPDLAEITEYIKKTEEKLRRELTEANKSDDKSSLLYILSLLCVAKGDKMAAIEHLIKVAEINYRILPTEVLFSLYSEMTDTEKVAMKKKTGHKLLEDAVQSYERQERHTREHGIIRMDPIPMPDKDLSDTEFERILTEKKISHDFQIIEVLFQNLKDPETHLVPKDIFKYLVDFWVENQVKCSQVKIDEGRLADDEVILKVSELIKTDFGLGRMCLTDKRLFFQTDVTNHFKEIAKLREIERLERSEHAGFLSRVPTLRIHKKKNDKDKDSVFTVYLKDDRNWWCMVIQEMFSGRVMAAAMKDVMMVQLAIQNALLIDAVIASGQETLALLNTKIEKVAEKLSVFSHMVDQGRHILPGDTRDALQTKLDPNILEKKRQTVQALLYTCGDEQTSPRLWCGLSDGKIKIYDAIFWNLEKELDQTKPHCMCLKVVGGTHVWAGSSGIFIFDVRVFSCNKTLMDHPDLISSIVPYDHGKYVYTASLDGTIIKWEVQRLSHAQAVIKHEQFNGLRGLHMYHDRMICHKWSTIFITELNGNILHSLRVSPETIADKSSEVDGVSVISNGQIWAGGRKHGLVHIWDITTGELLYVLDTDESPGRKSDGIASIAEIDKKVWIGTKSGDIRIFSAIDRKFIKKLSAHEDCVRVLCDVNDSLGDDGGTCISRYIISGGGSADGRVCIWSASVNTTVTDSGNFVAKVD